MGNKKSTQVEPTAVDNENEGYGNAYKFEPDFTGPVKKRSCTDVLCLGLFLLLFVAWGFVAFQGISKGDINKLLYPTNSLGQICGQGDFKDRPYLLFFDLTQCLNPAVISLGCPTPQICVKECPSKTEVFFGNGASFTYSKMKIKPYCALDADFQKSIKDLVLENSCPSWVLESKPFLGRCFPMISTGSDKDNDTITDQDSNVLTDNGGKEVTNGNIKHALMDLGAFLSVRKFGERVFNDLSHTWWMIGIGFILACVLSFVWILLMRFFTGIMVWTSIGLIFVLVSGLFGYSLHRYYQVKDITTNQINILQVNLTPDYLNNVLQLADTWLAFAIILGILTGIVLLVLIALRNRIQIAVELLEQAAKAVGQLCSSIFWPIFPFVLHVLVVLWWVAIAMYLTSAGTQIHTVNHISAIPPPDSCFANENCLNPVTNEGYKQNDTCHPSQFNQTCRNCPQITCQFTRYEKEGGWFGSWMIWFNLFAFYWTMEFVTALGELVLAGVFSQWYWTHDKSKLPCCSLSASLANATYHLGTVAFGSLLIAIIRFIRAILNQIEKKLLAHHNDLTRCLLCLCKCCLWCLEKFMRFLNRNAYIMCAMKGSNFCVSAKDAFNLLMRNIVRVVVLNGIVNFLLFIGKLVIVVGVGTLSYFFFSRQIPIPELQDEIPTLNFLFTPITVIVIGTYFITSSFFSVYIMAVDTLFLCFLEDLERNDGTPQRPYFMPKGLQKVVGKMQQFKDDQAQHQMAPLKKLH